MRNQGVGLSGFLAPDGKWYACGYAEHGDLAIELAETYALDYNETNHNDLATEGDFVKFGLNHSSDTMNGHVFFNHSQQLNQEQVDWLYQNVGKGTERQQRDVYRHMVAKEGRKDFPKYKTL